MEDETQKSRKPDGAERAKQLTIATATHGETSSKELWQMTRAEYEARHGQLRSNTTVTGRFSPHMNAVEIAINRGLPVPKEVLADYPNLASG